MSVAARQDRFVSREEYRRWCDGQPRGRFERIDGRIVAMAPERAAHLRVKAAVWRALDAAIAAAGLACEALPDGATVETGDSDYEPDATVHCGPPMGDDDIAVPCPVIIVEVLSPGTASVDTGGKLAGYFRVASVMHYLIVHPTQRNITHHRRTGAGIVADVVVSGRIVMDPPGISLAVDDVYGALRDRALLEGGR